MPVRTLFSWLLMSSAMLLGLPPIAAGDLGRLEVKIHTPRTDQTLTGSEASVHVDGAVSIGSGVTQLDVFFVLDTSRSLDASDPYEDRLKGAEGLIDSLPSWADIRVGVVGFDREAELVLPLTSDRKAVVDALRGLDRLGFTNIAGGIRTALAGFDASTRPDASRAILLFTDGRSDATAAREAMTEARAQGVAIHSLMLGSDPMGKELLSELAHATGGDFVQVTDARDLPHLLSALRTTGVEKVTLRLNDWPPIPTTLADGRFTAQMHLSVGENRILATATSFDGQTESDVVTIVLRPPGCSELQIQATVEGRPAVSVSERSVEIVFDSSGSMWAQIDGRAKMDVAKETIGQALVWLPPDLRLSLRAYGHQHRRQEHHCRDTQLLVTPGWGNHSRIAEAIAHLRPRGQTPIAHSLAQIARDMSGIQGEKAVILVTDGIESCGGDVVAAARALQKTGPIPVHVIGFGLESTIDSDLDRLRAIADASGGKFLTASTAAELRDALSTSVGAPYAVVRDGSTVARGTLGADEVLRLSPGDYVVNLETTPALSIPVTLDSEARHGVTFELKNGSLSHSTWREPAEYSQCEPEVDSPPRTLPAAPTPGLTPIGPPSQE
jgi:Mg-chelatase subunit ChlD